MADDKPKQPEVPEAQQFDTGSLMKSWEQFYQPQTSSDYMSMYKDMIAAFPQSYNTIMNTVMRRYGQDYNTAMTAQQAWVPQLIQNELLGQKSLYDQQQLLNRQQAPLNYGVSQGMVPSEFKDLYSSLGASLNQDIASGYNLGPALQSEVEQSIRGAQTARGNWLGPAPTAQEAYGTGQAAVDLYNSRVANSQNFLNGQNINDVGNQAFATMSGQPYYPSQTYLDPAMAQNSMAAGAGLYSDVGNQAGNVFSTIGAGQSNYNSALGSAQSNYNSALLGANDQNNNYMYQQYDRQADAFMYNEAVAHGLYSTPQVGSSGGMGGSGMSSMIGGIGSAVAGVGAAAISAGAVTGGAAVATGVGAAASAAAAALCWLARKLAPECWKSYRKYLFTKAPLEEREFYIFNARRLANTIG